MDQLHRVALPALISMLQSYKNYLNYTSFSSKNYQINYIIIVNITGGRFFCYIARCNERTVPLLHLCYRLLFTHDDLYHLIDVVIGDGMVAVKVGIIPIEVG